MAHRHQDSRFARSSFAGRQRSRLLPVLLVVAAALPAPAVASASASAEARAASAEASAAATRDAADARVRHRSVVRARPGRPLLVTGKRGFLGVDLLELTPELRRHFDAGDDAGVLVAHVESGSPAALAGLLVGDVLVAIEGKPVKGWWDLREIVAPRKAGEVVSLEVVRDGAHRQLQATLVEREGRVLELGKLMEGHLLESEDGDGTVVVVPNAKDWEKFGEEMGRWGEQLGSDLAAAFADPQVGVRIEREVDERARLQGKIEALERRLRDLEKRLEEQRR
jgi:membrane-associated protease RseP (regulator of RpoE activity)